MLRAWRAGVGVGALALAGCSGPETYNTRDGDGGEEEEATVPAVSPLAVSATEPVQEEADKPSEDDDSEADENEVAQAQSEVQNSAEPVAIIEPSMPDDVVDPLIWRERYHWRELAKSAGRDAGPVETSSLSFHGPAPLHWTPFDARRGISNGGSLLPLVYSQLLVMSSGDSQDAHHGQIEGDLAQGWEIPEPTKILFKLHGNVRWLDEEPLDGRLLTASDVKITHEAYLSPGRPQERAYQTVERIEADDREMTVSFHLREAASYLPAAMTDPGHVVGPPHHVDDPSEAMFSGDLSGPPPKPKGTGPFILEYSTPVSWGAVRNPLYFKQDQAGARQLPYLHRIRGGILISRFPQSTSLPSREEIWADWAAGRFDALELAAPSELDASRSLFPDLVAQVVAPSPGRGSVLTFAQTSSGRLADARVRQALSMAIDRVDLTKRIHHGLAAPDCGHDWTHLADESNPAGFREWPWAPEELGGHFIFNPEEAQPLLSAAGYSTEMPLQIKIDQGDPSRFSLGTNTVEVAAVAHQWQKHLGSVAQVLLLPRNMQRHSEDGFEFTIAEPQEDADILAYGQLPKYAADPDSLTYERLHSSRNSLVQDAELDKLCEQQRVELDPVRRSELLEQIRKRDIELGWRLTLVNPYGLVARREGVFNVGASYLAHSFDLNPKQFEQAWQLPE